LIAKALTLWCPVDAEHKKPTSVSDEVRQRFTVTTQD
jgi:acyl-CoA thioesterase FadM